MWVSASTGTVCTSCGTCSHGIAGGEALVPPAGRAGADLLLHGLPRAALDPQRLLAFRLHALVGGLNGVPAYPPVLSREDVGEAVGKLRMAGAGGGG